MTFNAILKKLVSEANTSPVVLSNEYDSDLKSRKVIIKRNKCKIHTINHLNHEMFKSYVVEISYSNQKIFILLIDVSRGTREFQLDNSRS